MSAVPAIKRGRAQSRRQPVMGDVGRVIEDALRAAGLMR
jgi:hypothetical protein